MSVRRLSVPKTVHLIYNREYGEDKEFVDHLPDIRVPLQQLGYQVKEYFVSPDTVKPLTRDIPPNDPSHIIFLHVDMPHKVPLGTRIETVR